MKDENGLRKIYDLRDDRGRIASILNGASGAGRFGLILDDGAFQSEGWWQQAEIHTVDGTIEGFGNGPMSDWSTFRIRTPSGDVTEDITQELGSGQPDLYRVGASARWRYVEVFPKTPLAGRVPPYPLTVEIWIGYDG